MPTATKVWKGNAQLKRLLVPVADLHPHPSNPRRGDVDALTASLGRFGQQRPILALPDGTIVAGHHVYYASQAIEAAPWTHIAVVQSDLTDAEVDAYLAADNRTAELGGYDNQALADLLARIDLDGTGYLPDDLDDLLAEIQETAPLPMPGDDAVTRDNTYAEFLAQYRNRTTRTIMLEYQIDTYESVLARLDALRSAHELESNAHALIFLLDAQGVTPDA